MCLIFYSYNITNVKKHITQFNSFSEHIRLYGGIGFAWFGNKSHKWKTLKRIGLYNSFPEEMFSTNILIGHIRKMYDGSAKNTIENVHPFSYKNQIFLHNGDTYNFDVTRKLFLKEIDKELRQHIKGETDTEYIFYMFLTIKKNLESREIYTNEVDILIKTTEILFRIMRQYYQKFRANFVYANKSYSIIVRYSFKDVAKDLYFNEQTSDNKLLISSMPITDNYKLIPSRTIIVVDHNKNTYITKKLI